jgi:aspartate kinase
MIVMKFGGTSVGDAPAIRRLVEIVRGRRADQPVVVVSALSKVSDQLLALPRLPQEERGPALSLILDRHQALVQELELVEGVMAPIRAGGAELENRLQALGAGAPDAAFLDDTVGFGELWSSRIVTAALDAGGIPGAWVDVRPVVQTDARFMAAAPERIQLPERASAAFLPLIAEGRVPVTQGFLGSAPDGRPTTLGRGGSDFTATLLGAALEATRVEIWTDVDGIMTADPRLVPEARLLPVASHHEAAELAAFGAKVLHPATQAPLVEAGIPCVVLNSFAPERTGTWVVSGATPEPIGPSPVRAVSCKRGISILNVRSPRMLGATGFLRRLFEVFERHQVSVDVIATSEVSVSLTVEEPIPLEALRADLAELGEVTYFPGRAIVAVVGLSMRDTPGLAAQIFQAVRDLNVEVISQGASAINFTFVVREEDAFPAVRNLHRELIELPMATDQTSAP